MSLDDAEQAIIEVNWNLNVMPLTGYSSEEVTRAIAKAHELLDSVRAAGYNPIELFRNYWALYPTHGVSDTAL